MWHVVFYMPGDREVSLLADCRRRGDVRALGVVDAGGETPGAALAEVMGLPVAPAFASLSPPSGAHVVAPRERRDDEDLRDAVSAGGLRAVGAEEFELLLAGREDAVPTPPAPPAPEPVSTAPASPDPVPPPATDVSHNAELGVALHTLGRIEESLDRERLPGWLLSVAVGAVGGDGGSLMLLDRRADQLYIAAAHGLSDRTLHTTRQALDAGIAGRVARTGRAELVTESRATTSSERGEITSALCVPLIHEDERLGVLNVNTRPPTRPFDAAALSDLQVVGDAVARILHASAGAERLRHGRLRRRLEHEFRELAGDGADLETTLAGWAAALAMALSADHTSLGVLREDGTLLLAEGTAEGETRTGTVPQQHPAWNDVLQSGRPVLVRPEDAPPDADGIAMYFLPVGREPTQAVLAVRFLDPADAHGFQLRADGVVEFLEERLPELRRRHFETDRASRLRDLADYLVLDRHQAGDPRRRRDDLAAYLKRAVGAVEIVFLPGADDLDGPRTAAARDLLSRVDGRGWLLATTSPGYANGSSSACLAVRRPGPGSDAGVVLFGKRRRDAADSATYTEFDAQIVSRLVGLLRDDDPSQPAAVPSDPTSVRDALRISLAREIDRADRYHVTFSLSAFDTGRPDPSAASLLDPVSARLRASDLLFPGPDGRLFVIAPEETQAVTQLERRAARALREAAADPTLPVRSGHAIYPGRDETPDELIRTALERLTERNDDDD